MHFLICARRLKVRLKQPDFSGVLLVGGYSLAVVVQDRTFNRSRLWPVTERRLYT